jgi:hypothetical protein
VTRRRRPFRRPGRHGAKTREDGDRLEIRITDWGNRVLAFVAAAATVGLVAAADTGEIRVAAVLCGGVAAALLAFSRPIVVSLDEGTDTLSIHYGGALGIRGRTVERPLHALRRAEVERAETVGGGGIAGVLGGGTFGATRISFVFGDGERLPLTRDFNSRARDKHRKLVGAINGFLRRTR